MKNQESKSSPNERRETVEELVKQARELGDLEQREFDVAEHIREIIRHTTTPRSEPEKHNILVQSLSTLSAQISRLQDQIEVTKANILTTPTA